MYFRRDEFHTRAGCSRARGAWVQGLLVLSLWGISAPPSPAAMADELDFGRDIRPILSDKCFQCHGADEDARQADLRFDVRDSALGDRDGSIAIVPGHPEQSLLMERIVSDDEYVRMPPPDSNKSLTPEEIEKLREWIRQGAAYERHWSFEPVRRPQVPNVARPGRVKNEIDAFVLRRLAEQGLEPSPEAGRAVLIRRLYQDLLGLLPTPEEADAFVADDDPFAYEQLVDRLLESPHYGERWGRRWLDQARYADSHGYTIDGARVMWPYRDWVIHALNQDMPFDQFTVEQLAGDLLPEPTKSQLIATAFHRNTLINQEGGVKPDQYRHEAVIDRVNTTGAVWLGLTVGCAQCHTHKFDPITHDEYYRLYAFFNNCVDANNAGPTVSVYEGEIFGFTDAQQQVIAELQSLRKREKSLEAAVKSSGGSRLESIAWDWKPVELIDYRTEGNASFRHLPDGSLLSDGGANENDTYLVTFRAPLQGITAVRLRVLTHESLPKHGPGLASNGNFVLTDVELQREGQTLRFVEAWADHAQTDYPVGNAIDDKAKSGWAINVDAAQSKRKPPPKMNAPHEAVFVLNAAEAAGKAALTLIMRHDANQKYLVGRFAIDVSQATVARAKESPRSELEDVRRRIARLEAATPGKGKAVSQMIMRDQEQLTPTYRLERGDFLNPDQEGGPLSPGVPAAVLPDGATPEFRNRLDLARWLVSESNPLTSRVIVNRIWMRYFGRGLVETENDFGYQGSPPTHPELLDWLASEFMRRGWSLKALHRLIVTSATYRQSSDSGASQAADPANVWLSRQSRLRVEGEVARDMALAAAGALVSTVGGPSVHPPQPEGVYSFTQTKKTWPESQGEDRYRRTLYTMFYRSAPYPLFTTFDAPDFSTVCTRRSRSNTPLQSLTIANDVVFFELAQQLARRAVSESPAGADPQRIAGRMFRLCLTRDPGSDELRVLTNYWQSEVDRYQKQSAAAREVASPDAKDEAGLAEAAAWTSVARVLINTDEFITRN